MIEAEIEGSRSPQRQGDGQMETRVYRADAKHGVIAQFETRMATYQVLERNGKVWIEAFGHGGRRINTPRITSVTEARSWCEQQTKPACPPDEMITL